MRWIVGLAGLLLFLPDVGRADGAFKPNVHPELVVTRAAGEIRIDGEVDDPGWEDAARAANFSETDPGDNTRPPIDTEVLVTYDDEHLYLAFLAGDDPSEVRASHRQRDEIFGDDYIGIILDTYGNASWAYEIFVNPLGLQGDLRMGDFGEDEGFDLVWESFGKITESGYQVEVAIPFSSLRFPDRAAQRWRATFWRNRPRESRFRYSWAAMNRDEPCWMCNFGTLTGIKNVKPGSRFDLLPSMVGSVTREPNDEHDYETGLEELQADLDASLGVRYAISSSLSIEGTLNPDFSQIESDEAQIDVNTTFALFFPERRPFFQEGSDLLNTYIPGVYTRSINDPEYAAKLTGRMDRSSIAYIGARDAHSPTLLPFQEQSATLLTGKSTSNILRYRREFGEDSHFGGLITDRRWDDGSSGSLVSADGQVRFLHNYSFETQWIASHTEEPDDTTLTADLSLPERFDQGRHTSAFDGESYWGHGIYASVERDGRLWGFDLDYWERSPRLRAANGFLLKNDYREAIAWTGLFFRWDQGFINQITPNLALARTWDTGGPRREDWIQPEIVFRFKGQTQLEIEHLWARERFRGIEFHDIRQLTVALSSDYLERFRLAADVSHVNQIARFFDPPIMGAGTEVELWALIKPWERLVIAPSYAHASLYQREDRAEIFSGYVLRTRTSLQFTREAALRLVVQYDRFDDRLDIEPLISYKANPFSVLYLGMTRAYESIRDDESPATMRQQIFLKLQYLQRI